MWSAFVISKSALSYFDLEMWKPRFCRYICNPELWIKALKKSTSIMIHITTPAVAIVIMLAVKHVIIPISSELLYSGTFHHICSQTCSDTCSHTIITSVGHLVVHLKIHIWPSCSKLVVTHVVTPLSICHAAWRYTCISTTVTPYIYICIHTCNHMSNQTCSYTCDRPVTNQ